MQCWTAGGWCCVDGGGQLDLQGCSPLPRLLICECWRVSGSGAPELTLFKALIFFCQQNTTKSPQTPGYIPFSSSVTTPAVAGKSVTPVSVLCVGSTESEGVDPLQCCSVCRLLQETASPARRGDTGGDRADGALAIFATLSATPPAATTGTGRVETRWHCLLYPWN